MPGKGSHLTSDEVKMVQKFITEKWKGRAAQCQLCGSQHWAVGDLLVAPMGYLPGRFVVGASTYPLVALICTNCGQTVFLNALHVGVLSREDMKKAKEEKDRQQAEEKSDV